MRTRREWLQSVAGLALAAPAFAIEPVRRSADKSHLKLSLAAYSFRKYLDLKKAVEPKMTIEGFAELAAGYGLSAIEPTAYYFPDLSAAALGKFRRHCTTLGLDVSGTAINNDFCLLDESKRREQVALVNAWSERAAIIGAKTVRIFAGKAPKGDSEDAARARCVPAIREACDYAAKFGVILALENHGGITATAEGILSIVRAVDHPFFGVNLDTGNFRTADPYGDLAKLAPYAVTVQVKTEVQPEGKPKQEADIPRLMAMLRGVGYRGYVALEYEADEEPKTAVPRYLAQMRKLMEG